MSERKEIKKIFKSFLKFISWLFKSVLILFIFAFIIKYFVLQPYLIDGPSMEPNFHHNEYLFLNKISYKLREPKRGEVIIFHPPNHPHLSYIKRIIALPGEKIVIENGKITLYNQENPSGFLLFEPYLPKGKATNGQVVQILGPDQYFVLGDNRENSVDSREFGAVPRKNIIGRAYLVIFPFSEFGLIQRPLIYLPFLKKAYAFGERLKIEGNLDEKGILSVSEEIFFSQPSKLERLFDARFSQLKIQEGTRILKKEEYRLKRKGQKTRISTLSSSSYWQVSYKLPNKIRYEKEREGFSWTVLSKTGKILDEISISISLPKRVEKEKIEQAILAFPQAGRTNYTFDGKELIFQGFGLGGEATFTIRAFWPKGVISLPFYKKKILELGSLGLLFWFILGLLLPLLSILVMLYLFLKNRRGIKIPSPTSLLSKPPSSLKPAILGTLLNKKMTAREISATILDLAQRGYLYILNKQEGFSFIKRKEDEDLEEFEKLLLEEIFKGGVKSTEAVLAERPIKELFSPNLSNVFKEVYQKAYELGLFFENPGKIRLFYKTIGILLFFFGVLGCLSVVLFSQSPYLIFPLFGVIFASFLIIHLSDFSPSYTQKGADEAALWLCFKLYLEEKGPLGYEEIKKGFFENYLPWAIVFGAERDWAGRFEKAPLYTPSWYSSFRSLSTYFEFTNDLFPMLDYISFSLNLLKIPEVG